MVGSMNDKILTLDEHLETADDLAIAAHHISRVMKRCQKHFPKGDAIMKQLERIDPWLGSSGFGQLRDKLDNNYHAMQPTEVRDDHGEIYFNLEERFNKLAKLKEVES
jgi:hypothetical protein